MKKSLFLIPLVLLSVCACTMFKGRSSSNTESTEPSSSSEPLNPDDFTFGTYSNPVPVFSGTTKYTGQVADPSVVRGDDGKLYCVATGGVMLESDDGCEWYVLTNSVIPHPTWADDYYDGLPGFWAPDLVKIGNKWMLYYSLSVWGGACGIGYASADNIRGPYTDHGKLFDSLEVGGRDHIGVGNSIDPQVFVDDDGSVYMVFGSFRGLYVIQLTDDGTACYQGIAYQREHKTLIAGQPTAWDGAQYEGSYIFKKDGWYYYMGSSGSCCNGVNSTYNVRVARSKSITGPYKDSDGMDIKMSSGTTTYGDMVVYSKVSNNDVKGPGHNSILVDDAGQYWIYAHAYLQSDNYGTRHLMMDKLEWSKDGMPYVPGLSFSLNEELDGPWFSIKDAE